MLSLLKMAIIIHTLTINIHLLWRNIIFNWGFSFTGVNHFKSFLKTDWWPTRRRMITDWLLCVCVACVHRCESQWVGAWVRGTCMYMLSCVRVSVCACVHRHVRVRGWMGTCVLCACGWVYMCLCTLCECCSDLHHCYRPLRLHRQQYFSSTSYYCFWSD